MGLPSSAEFLVIFLVIFFIVSMIYFIKSDIRSDHNKPLSILNWIGTFLYFSIFHYLYIIILTFNMKKLHPSKQTFVKVMWAFPLVIVLLGIIASIAIPKLAATRDDAKIAQKLNYQSQQKDIAQYLQYANQYYRSSEYAKAKEFYGKACDIGSADGCKYYAILNKKGY